MEKTVSIIAEILNPVDIPTMIEINIVRCFAVIIQGIKKIAPCFKWKGYIMLKNIQTVICPS